MINIRGKGILEYIESDYMYLKFSKMKKLLSTLIFMAISLYTIYFFKPSTAIYLSTTIETILIFTITFIATTVFKFSNKKIFKFISIYLLLVAIFKFDTLIYLISFLEEKDILEGLILKSVAISTILESVYCFIIISYVKIIDLKTKVIVFLLTVSSLISLLFFEINLFWLFTFILLNVILYALKSFKVFKNKYFNYLKAFVIINLSLVILDFLAYNIGLKSLILLGDLLKIGIYLIIYLWISEMLIVKPYEILHKDIIDKNKKLKLLSRKMEESNREFKEFKKKLRENELYFRDFLNTVPMAIVILKSDNHRILNVNKRCLYELNLKGKRKLINKNLFKIIKVHNEEEFFREKKGEASLKILGREIFWELDILLKSNNYLIISMKNITEFKYSEKIRNNLNKKTLSEQIKNDFLSSISHDLKTPINVIYSSVQVQEKFYSDKYIDKVDYYNQVNKENCMTLLRLANNLIDSSKIDYNYLKPNLKIYNIVNLVEDSIGNLSEYIKEKNLTYVFDTNEEEVYVKCDQEFMQRIILNLISNSIKHTKEGGIGVEIIAKRNKVLVSFTDTGEGMERDFVDKAFLRYTKGNKKGVKNKSTGIGLYIVKNLVELQKGSISISSIKDAGTNIRLEFSRENCCGI